MRTRSGRFEGIDLAALEAQAVPTSAVKSSGPSQAEPTVISPTGTPVGNFDPELGLRAKRLAELRTHKNAAVEVAQDLQCQTIAPGDRAAATRRLSRLHDEVERLEDALRRSFIPQHSERQLISPEYFLVTRLFNVRGKSSPREKLVMFELSQVEGMTCTYTGPELRQADGHVFMTLLNLTRDFKVGTEVSFEAAEMCTSMYGYYDGKSRQRLKDAVKRLMLGVISFPEFTVHLVQRFNHPSSGRWSVVLDDDIVKLFQKSTHIWLDAQTRRLLPEGLATWLYGYVRSQSHLCATPLSHLRQESGSDAQDDDTFRRRLSVALQHLSDRAVIDGSWSIRAGVVRWSRLKRLAIAA